MRVIAGSAKSLALKTVEGISTRPTTDRIKETLFNMIHDRIYDCVFLDLFSGSGGIGIEALSRGAKSCYFVENNGKAIKCIEGNLEFTKLKQKAIIMNKDVISSIKSLSGNVKAFSIIFMDPPYNMGLEIDVLKNLKNEKLIDEDTLIIVEADINTNFDYLFSMGLEIIKEKKYKTNKHVFIGLEVE